MFQSHILFYYFLNFKISTVGIKLVLASIYRDVYISLTLTIGAPNDPPSASPVAVSHAYFTLDFFQIFCGTVGDGPHLGAADGDSAAVYS